VKVLIVGSGSLALSVIPAALLAGHEVGAVRGHRYMSFGPGLLGEFDVVLNCHGQNPKRMTSSKELLEPSLLLAGQLAQDAREAGVTHLHISTDCVLGHQSTGRLVQPLEYDLVEARPDDAYGYVMALREVLVREEGGIAVRASWVTPREGIWADLVENETFGGWRRAIWSGSTTRAVAQALVRLAEYAVGVKMTDQTLNIATREPASKFEIARHIAQELELGCQVEPVAGRDDFRPMSASMPELVTESILDMSGEVLESVAREQLQEPDYLTPQDWRDLWFGPLPDFAR
jgi:dTDP-4-dehydrorhamnose reductase